MNRPNDAPEILLLSDLEKEYTRLNFLVDTGDANIRKEMEISLPRLASSWASCMMLS